MGNGDVTENNQKTIIEDKDKQLNELKSHEFASSVFSIGIIVLIIINLIKGQKNYELLSVFFLYLFGKSGYKYFYLKDKSQKASTFFYGVLFILDFADVIYSAILN